MIIKVPVICAQPQNFSHVPELVTLYMNNAILQHYKKKNYDTVSILQSRNSLSSNLA